MIIKRLVAKGYRNIDNIEISPDEGMNIIFGENAQGKTNLLESIWLFTGCKSFRGTKDSELVAFTEGFAKIEMDFFAKGRDQKARIIIENQRSAVLNGVSLPSPSKLMGEFRAVVFSPSHLSLVKDGPSERRRFLDTALCQLSPSYAGALRSYNHILAQRNSLLKDIQFHSGLLDTLEIWDKKLAERAVVITDKRKKYLEMLNGVSKEIYNGLSHGKEEMDISYNESDVENNNQGLNFTEILKKQRKCDILTGTTSAGPHRDDISISVDSLKARQFGSQGQQRSCALALKLSEAKIIKDVTGEQPVMLLDDVMSELDITRQDYILNHIKGWQVFITCCEPSAILKMFSGKAFEIKKGETV